MPSPFWILIDQFAVQASSAESTSLCVSPNNPTVYRIERAVRYTNRDILSQPLVRLVEVKLLAEDVEIFVTQPESFVEKFLEMVRGHPKTWPNDKITVIIEGQNRFLIEDERCIRDIINCKIGLV